MSFESIKSNLIRTVGEREFHTEFMFLPRHEGKKGDKYSLGILSPTSASWKREVTNAGKLVPQIEVNPNLLI